MFDRGSAPARCHGHLGVERFEFGRGPSMSNKAQASVGERDADAIPEGRDRSVVERDRRGR